MKKRLVILLILLSTSLVAQRKNTISFLVKAAATDEIGVAYEKNDNQTFLGLHCTQIICLTKSELTLYNKTIPNLSIKGTGLVGEYGYRLYLNKERFNRWYLQNSISGGFVNFDSSYYINNYKYNYQGTYSYFSIFQPEIGYRINMGRFSIDPAIGWQWDIEFKEQGDFDNKLVENTFVKAGIKLGYSF